MIKEPYVIFSEIVDSLRTIGTITDVVQNASGKYLVTANNSFKKNSVVSITNSNLESFPNLLIFEADSVSFVVDNDLNYDNQYTYQYKSDAPYFMHEEEKKAHDRLAQKTSDAKWEKYPLVLLLHPYKVKYPKDDAYANVPELKIAIVNLATGLDTEGNVNSATEKNSDQRYEDNFIPILDPIFDGLINGIIKHQDSPVYVNTDLDYSNLDKLLLNDNPLPDLLDGKLLRINDFKIKYTCDTPIEVTKYQLKVSIVGDGVVSPNPGTYLREAGTTVRITTAPDPGKVLFNTNINEGEFITTDAWFDLFIDGAKRVVTTFVDEIVVLLQVFITGPIQKGISYWFGDGGTEDNDVEISNIKVGTFNGTIFVSFVNLNGVTITSFTGTSTPTKISDQRINFTAGFSGQIGLSNGSILVFNHGEGSTVYDLLEIHNGTINIANLETFWGSEADNIEPCDTSVGCTLYEKPEVLVCDTAGITAYDATGGTGIPIPAYGEFRGSFERISAVVSDYLAFISDGTETTLSNQGYVLFLHSTGALRLRVGITAVNLFITVDGYLDLFTAYEYLIQRNSVIDEFVIGAIGTMAVYIKGGAFLDLTLVQPDGEVLVGGVYPSNPVTDNTYATYKYQSFNLTTGTEVSKLSTDNIPIDVADFQTISGAFSINPSLIMPICFDKSEDIAGFTRLGYFPRLSGILKGLPNTYHITGVEPYIADGFYTSDEIAAFTPTANLTLMQTEFTVTLLKVIE